MTPARRTTSTVVVVLIMGTVFLYGLVMFSDAPISKAPDGTYRGKQGQLHTREDFRRFTRWENTFLILWPCGIVGLILLNKGRYRRTTPFE